MTTIKIRTAGKTALAYIAANPGTSILAVDRAVRTARGGHAHMYATVHRLIKAGLVVDARINRRPGTYALIATEAGRSAL